jgi:hypothetical protein
MLHFERSLNHRGHGGYRGSLETGFLSVSSVSSVVKAARELATESKDDSATTSREILHWDARRG